MTARHLHLCFQVSIKGGYMKIDDLAKVFSEENGLSEEINQAYINNVGIECGSADVLDAYYGEYDSDEDFARSIAEELGLIKDVQWPYTCIDWERAANDIMYDYFESEGYYFRNI